MNNKHIRYKVQCHYLCCYCCNGIIIVCIFDGIIQRARYITCCLGVKVNNQQSRIITYQLIINQTANDGVCVIKEFCKLFSYHILTSNLFSFGVVAYNASANQRLQSTFSNDCESSLLCTFFQPAFILGYVRYYTAICDVVNELYTSASFG